MKKLLTAMLICSLLLFSTVFAGTYPDVSDDIWYAKAIETVSRLGFFTGYEDGTFLPDKTITRAEFAAIICRFREYPQDQSAGVFSDVSSTHWAKGYINGAYNYGIINGDGAGHFMPEQTLTFEQSVKMIVCALGYKSNAESAGGYPGGYLSVAKNLGITDGLTFANQDGAPRWALAVMLYHATGVKLQ